LVEIYGLTEVREEPLLRALHGFVGDGGQRVLALVSRALVWTNP